MLIELFKKFKKQCYNSTKIKLKQKEQLNQKHLTGKEVSNAVVDRQQINNLTGLKQT